MPNDPISFDERSVRRIMDVVQWAERQMRGGPTPGGNRPYPIGTLWRFGRTCANPGGGSYPTAAATNTYWVQWEAETYTAEEGEKTRTETELADLTGVGGTAGYTLAQAFADVYVPEDSLVACFHHNGLWWIDNRIFYAQCNALAKGAVSSGDSTYTVDNVTPLFGSSPVTSSSDEITVRNRYADDLDDNAKVSIIWNQTDGEWQTGQITCPA